MDKIKLVQGDTRPQLLLSLTDDSTGLPIDISDAGTTVVMNFRMVGASSLTATLPATKLPGLLRTDGTINYASPYDVYGAGGRCLIQWTSTALSGAPGNYEGEIVITFSDGTVQTVYDVLRFRLRQEFPSA